MRYQLVLLTVFLLLFLVGCSNKNNYGGEPGITGYIMDKVGQDILIVSTKATDFSENGGTEEFYDVIWASKSPENVKLGDHVKIWFKGDIETSYPSKATVGKLEVTPSFTPKDAALSDNEALNKALSKGAIENGFLAVQSISYDTDKNEWSILLKDINSYEEYTIEVEDK